MQTKINSTNIASTGVTAGSYTNANITVNESGQITSASNGTGGGGGGGGGTGLQFTTYTYTADGTTTIYNASSGITVDTVLVILDGVTQTPTSDYTVSANTVVFTSAPPSGSQIQIRVLGDVATTTVPKITAIQVTDSSYNVLDDTAVSTSGGYIKITGTGFTTGPQVVVGSLVATSISYISSTELRCQIPAQAAGTYTVYVTNSDSSVAIRVNGLNYSNTPTWSTTSPLPNGTKNSPISIQLAASSNTSVTYALANGSTLPTGLSLTSGGLLSGTVSTITVETTYNFTIVATDGENQDTPQAFQITVIVGDPYFRLTSLLLSGSALSANTVIKDSSTNNFNLIAYGDSRASNFTPYGTGWSVYFDGTGDYLSISTNAALNLSSGDFTIEGWAYWTGSNSGGTILNKDGVSGTSFPSYLLSLNGSGYFRGVVGSGNGTGYIQTITSSVLAPINQWVHLAFVKNGTTLTLYQNGTNVGSATQTGTIVDGAKAVLIGYETGQGSTVYWSGYISNTRIVKGTALYTANFTPATTNLTAVANTSLLTCNANRFLDASTNNFTVTPNGDARVVSFNPFGITNTGTAGSMYFDGTDDYVTVGTTASNAFAFSGDFTIEAWFYKPGNGSDTYEVLLSVGDGNGVNGFFLEIDDTRSLAPRLYMNTGALILDGYVTSKINDAQWHHIACVRSGSNCAMFYDGTRVATSTSSASLVSSGSALHIGRLASGSTNDFYGYVSDVRIINGTAAYNPTVTSITVPTQPLTAVTNTQLLTLQYRQPHNNHGFQDSSTNNHLITRSGNTTQGTFSPFSQTGWGNYFNGSSSILETSTSIFGTWSTANASTTTATIEAMVYVNALQSAPANAYQNPSIINKGNTYLNFSVNSTGNIVFFHYDGSFRYITSSGTIQANTWNYVAVTITGGTATIYINGTSSGSGTWYGIQTVGLVAPTYIGQTPTGQYWNGYISNLRVSSTVRTIATPLVPYTNDGNTSLLTCQSNRFRDASTNGYTITATGSPSVVAFSPFAPTAAYTTTAVGGSGYFDSNGDYLDGIGTASDWAFMSNSTALWSFECWLFVLSSGEQGIIDTCGGSSGNVGVYISKTASNTILADITRGVAGTRVANGTTTGTLTPNAWNHLLVTYDQSLSTQNLKIYINGGSAETFNKTANAPSGSNPTYSLRVGGFNAIATLTWNGYISSLRISNVARSSSVPTAPYTSDANTKLLLNFTNAGITDATAKNDLETVGNAKISTTQSKWGGGSMYFDGTGDYLRWTTSNFFNVYQGSNTVEMWIYPTSISSGGSNSSRYGTLFVQQALGSSIQFGLGFNSSGQLVYTYWNGSATVQITSTETLSVNTWSHVGFTYTSSGIALFVNGVYKAPTAITGSPSASATEPMFIGIEGRAAGSELYYQGYIDDLRITKGVARYTSNFTAPTAPFPVQ